MLVKLSFIQKKSVTAKISSGQKLLSYQAEGSDKVFSAEHWMQHAFLHLFNLDCFVFFCH